MTKISTQIRRRERAALLRAIACMGGLDALAKAIDRDLSYQAVQGWLKARPPSFERCAAIELATRGMVQCEELNEGYWRISQRPYRRAAA